MKTPRTDSSKISLPGEMTVVLNAENVSNCPAHSRKLMLAASMRTA